MQELKIEYRKVSDLTPYARNSRTHSDIQVQQIANSITEFGFTNPVLIDHMGEIIAGHGRVMAAVRLGLPEVPCIMLGHLSDRQKRAYVIADNKLALNAGWDFNILADEVSRLSEEDYDLDVMGFDEQELDAILKNDAGVLPADFFTPPSAPPTKSKPIEGYNRAESGAMFKKFIYPPFSVLNTMSGAWQERKKAWAARVGDFGESREGTLGRDKVMMSIGNGVSILDGCLAELVCRWFGREGWKAFDPFAGDTVFGFVSASCGMEFVGIELRKEQAELNQARVSSEGLRATYHNDDALNMDKYVKRESVDLVFSCPPYADLEVYSDDPRDISNMNTDEFFRVYTKVLHKTYAKLKENRFAVIVIGEVRGADGSYINLVGRTIQAMEGAGYKYYNEIILYTSAGTLPIRAGRVFNSSRKIGKTHQNVLVFYKGDISLIKNEFGEVISEEENEDGEGLQGEARDS